jgi:neopullulanase
LEEDLVSVEAVHVATPDWVKDAVFYQIFPDRFARGPAERRMTSGKLHELRFQPWGSPPTANGFMGGDLYGVIEHLPYIAHLGCNAIYLNPIFSSASNHRYHTYDYLQVDPLLGGNEALRALLDAAHEMKMRVILDGVFNHASRGFFAFHHLMECGPESPYNGWFHVYDWPVRAYSGDPNYACWWELPALPAFNTDNPEVREYLWDVAVHWLKEGIDGWRLDVADEIDDDSFWQEFRLRCRQVNPEAYIVAELWHLDASRWLAGDQFDAQMNYPFMRDALGFFAGDTVDRELTSRTGLGATPALDGVEFGLALDQMHHRYHPQIVHAQLNMLGSHDTARLRTLVGGDLRTVSLLYLCQITVAGPPNIFYGDEIGLAGGHEPECRPAFPWHMPETWDSDLRAELRRYIRLRHTVPCLRRGRFLLLHSGPDTLVYRRAYYDSEAVIAFNVGEEPRTITVAAGRPTGLLTDALDPAAQPFQAGAPITLPPRSGRVWTSDIDALGGEVSDYPWN